MASNIDISKFLAPHNLAAARTVIEEECSDPILLKMLEDGLHADITLNARGGSVKAHRSVLASVSPVFNAMFQHDMREQRTSSVDILHMTIDSLRLFLFLLYITNDKTCELPELDAAVDEHFAEFHEAYHRYQVMDRLRDLYEGVLARNLTHDNCWDYYRYHKSQDSDLSDFGAVTASVGVSICTKYMLDKYLSIIHSNSFALEMERDPTSVHKFLKRVVPMSRTTKFPKANVALSLHEGSAGKSNAVSVAQAKKIRTG